MSVKRCSNCNATEPGIYAVQLVFMQDKCTRDSSQLPVECEFCVDCWELKVGEAVEGENMFTKLEAKLAAANEHIRFLLPDRYSKEDWDILAEAGKLISELSKEQ